MLTKLVPTAIILLALPILSASAGEKPFPKKIYTPNQSQPEGFTIGKGTTAYNGSYDGSIYKFNLRTGQGEYLVPPEGSPDDCLKLGMRVNPRTNFLFVATCVYGKALVYDADTGDLLMEYQLGPEFESIINDLAITKDAVYFTDSFRPVLYRLPLSKNGGLPTNADGVTEILLPDVFAIDPDTFCCGANGIVATPNGKTLIVGHANNAQLFRVDPTTGYADEIIVDPPLSGFLDGIVLHDGILFILTPGDTGPEDVIQVVVLGEDMLTGNLVGIITDPGMDGIASGAMHGDSLYVNNAVYSVFPEPDTQYWVIKLNIYDVE
jgi:hypothetical protein